MTCHCGRPTAGAWLCPDCVHTLDVALANIAAYWPELAVVRQRQARLARTQANIGGGKGGTKTQPLPIDARFADRLEVGSRLDWETRNTVGTWARVVMEEHPPVREQVPRDTIVSICAYLQSNLRWISGQQWSEDMLDELLDVERRLRRMIDRPADAWYAGPCTAGQDDLAYAALCGQELYVTLGRDVVTCRACGFSYEVAARRAWLLAAAEDRLETASVIARAVVTLGEYERGERRLVVRIGQWAADKRLLVRDTVPVGGKARPRYRIGDVLDLIAEDANATSQPVRSA